MSNDTEREDWNTQAYADYDHGVGPTAPTLTDFLLARIAEDEAVANDASEERLWAISQANDRVINDAGHMQRFMPSRVLADCQFKRAVIGRLAVLNDGSPATAVRVFAALAALGKVYADHPDYRKEWKP